MIIEIFSFSFVLDSRGMRQIILGCALLHLIMMASTKGLIPSWNDSAHIKDEQFSYISNMLSIDSKRLNPEGLSTKYLHSRLEPIRTINKVSICYFFLNCFFFLLSHYMHIIQKFTIFGYAYIVDCKLMDKFTHKIDMFMVDR